MDINGRFNHIEDVLVNLHNGQWFGWSDSMNKVYANLIIHDETKDKPTKKFLEDELKKQQDAHDAQAYARTRAPLYPAIGDQLDDLYKKGAFSDEMAAKLKKVKDDNPKPS
jgi:hypothetical protein